MGTIPRPRIVSPSTNLDVEDLPEQVTITVRELAGAVKQGLGRSSARCRMPSQYRHQATEWNAADIHRCLRGCCLPRR